MNYIRCDDLPIVFNQLLNQDKQVIQDIQKYANDVTTPTTNEYLCYGGTERLTVPFQPEKLQMFPESGRIYHPGLEHVGGVGLIKSSLALELSKYFVYNEGASDFDHPIKFNWKGRNHILDNTVLLLLKD